METSQQISGGHIAPSPSGQFIASIATGKLSICATQAPERVTEINIRVQSKDVTALRWNDDSDRVAILSHRLIEVVDLHDDSHRVRLDNGSGGLGKFAAADFIGADQLLVMWEFGKAKVWNLVNGKGADLSDIKTTCSGDKWQLRPKGKNAPPTQTRTQTLATLSRSGVDDVVHLYLPSLQKAIQSTKLPTTDAQSLSWFPDGRWLAILDTPTASPSVHFYTPDGHLFRSYPSSPQDASHVSAGLGIKSLHWAGGSSLTLALTRFDGKIALLNTRTFTPLAIIEHHTVIDQSCVPPEQQAPIWQEMVSASGERSYGALAQPFSPPLSRTKPTTEPSDSGVAEACFSCDGAYLATRDERMLNTVWIWDVSSLAAHAVVVQHGNVRRMMWHPSRPESLLLNGGEGMAYLFDASLPRQPPVAVRVDLPGASVMSWVETEAEAPQTILCATKVAFQLLYPEGRAAVDAAVEGEVSMVPGDGEGDDSLLDMLSGRTPLPPRTEQSYTERIDIEVETEEGDSTTRMEDTFRGKQIFSGRQTGRKDSGGDGTGGGERDPFDDSQIF